MRFTELINRLIGISEHVLIAKRKELETEGLIYKTVYTQVPLKVE